MSNLTSPCIELVSQNLYSFSFIFYVILSISGSRLQQWCSRLLSVAVRNIMNKGHLERKRVHFNLLTSMKGSGDGNSRQDSRIRSWNRGSEWILLTGLLHSLTLSISYTSQWALFIIWCTLSTSLPYSTDSVQYSSLFH